MKKEDIVLLVEHVSKQVKKGEFREKMSVKINNFKLISKFFLIFVMGVSLSFSPQSCITKECCVKLVEHAMLRNERRDVVKYSSNI